MADRFTRDSRRFDRPSAPRVRIPGPFEEEYAVDMRLVAMFALFAVVAVLIVGRLAYLQLFDPDGLAESAHSDAVEITPRRGTIYDRNGVVLATTVDAVNIFCHPHMVPSDKVDELAEFLATNCGGEADDYKEKITADKNFSYLFKGADASLGEAVTALGIDGVDYEETTKRVYPCGAVGSQVIGVVNSEGTAISGLELYYDDILGGEAGERSIQYSKEGVPIPGTENVIKEAVAGEDIVVSIDVALQEQLETTVSLRVETVQGKTGSGIVMDAATGEIYACSSSPTFDITDLSEIEEGATNLSGISSSYEPGSTFKAVTMLAALEEGTTTAGQSYWCPSEIEVGQYTISDAHDRSAQEMDTTQIIADSSNIGMSLIAEDLGAENLYNYIQKYGMVQSTGVDYPGEASGSVTDWSQWSDAQTYNIAFGQGITTTPMATVRFYAMVANGGVAVQPHFLLDVPSEDEPRSYDTTVVTENTDALNSLIQMLEAVVEEGTATDAQISGYSIAAKTGTAQTADEQGGYKESEYNISTVGFIPNASLELVCFVGANDVPGDRKTVPAFRDIMAYAIDRYGITQK